MATTKKTNSFLFIFSSVFIFSFFGLRAILDKIEWSYGIEVIIQTVVSGVMAAILSPQLNSTEKRAMGGVYLGVYLLALVGVLVFTNGENVKFSEVQVGDTWATKESDGEDFVMDFFKKDSVRLIFPPNDSMILGYSWSNGKLLLHDEEGNLLFDWKVKVEQGRFIILQGDDKLIFYKR